MVPRIGAPASREASAWSRTESSNWSWISANPRPAPSPNNTPNTKFSRTLGLVGANGRVADSATSALPKAIIRPTSTSWACFSRSE